MRLISLLLMLLIVNCISAQDTVFSRIDTTLCSLDETQLFFQTPYDTSVFQTTWLINDSQDELYLDSLAIIANDSLLLVTSFQDTTMGDSIFIDTILIDIRFRPNVDFSIPDPTCFDGSNDDLCPDNSIDSTFKLSTLLQPTALFNFPKTCENEFLLIENMSTEVIEPSSYRFYESNALLNNFNQAESFSLSDTLSDGSVIILGIADNGNGCLDTIETIVTIDSVT